MILDSSSLVNKYFEKICSIPHLSCQEKELSDYVVAIAKEQGHYVRQDQWYNVVVIAEASEGYENAEPLMLQGHLDMVGTKSADSDFNFLTDPLQLQLDGNILTAKDTTLGADDGVAVAIMLALLSDKKLKHPRLECLFTTQEEIGTDGAEKMDISDTVATRMINLDGEGEEDITVGCYCSDKITLKKELKPIEAKKKAIRMHLSGFEAYGNKSERRHPLKVFAQALSPLADSVEIVSLHCGIRENMPPTEMTVQCCGEANVLQQLTDALKANCRLEQTVEETDYVHSIQLNKDILCLIENMPDGQLKEDEKGDMIAIFMFTQMDIDDKELRIIGSDRCRDDQLNRWVKDIISEVGKKAGCIMENSVRYISWPYQKDSKLKQDYCAAMKKYYNITPNEKLCPGGLEVTDFLAKRPELDILSIGVNCGQFHTTSEWLDVDSMNRMVTLLSHLLEDTINN